MKKSVFIMLIIITSVVSTALVMAEEKVEQLNPMVLIELNASMKGDWVLAERMVAIDIKDNLADVQKLSKQTFDFLKSDRAISGQVLAINARTDRPYIKIAE